MRVVVDTNVFVSAALKESSWPAIVVRWIEKHGILPKNALTEHEVLLVLQRPHIASHISPLFAENLRRIFSAAESVAIMEQMTQCRDPKDNKFLELAVSGRADVMVSGDADLLALNPFRNIPVLDPTTFGRSQVP